MKLAAQTGTWPFSSSPGGAPAAHWLAIALANTPQKDLRNVDQPKQDRKFLEDFARARDPDAKFAWRTE